MDISGDLPPESLVEQIVFGGGRQIFTSTHHMSDPHEVIVHHIGKVVSGHTILFQQDLIVQDFVFNFDLAENGVLKGGCPGTVDALPDHIGRIGSKFCFDRFG